MAHAFRFCPSCSTELQPTETLEDGGLKTRLRCPACGWTHWNNPTPVLAAIIECADQGGRVLLARNAAWSGRMFALITGFMEAGETPEEGVAREALEETAHGFRPEFLVGIYQWPKPGSDITYLRTGEGWLYLCAVRDGHSRRIIGWSIEDHLHTDLVEAAVAMAVALRGQLPGQVILHADRGCQYTSAQMARVARTYDLARSVGRTGVCWDNAAAESFWATLKVEFYDRYLWPTKAAAKLAVGDWIERVYNRRRRHSAIGMITPVEYENRIHQTAQAA